MDTVNGRDNGKEEHEFVFRVSQEAKLRELLRNLTSIELKLCSDASKEFIKILRGDSGYEFLREYIRTSSQCSELLQAWKLRQGKVGLSFILTLVSAILSHPNGRYKPNDVEGLAISRALDKFARSIIDDKLGDIYKELNSKEPKRQNATLSLLASIVRRGSVLASDVAKNFDFKLPTFLKLVEWKKKRFEVKRTRSTRKSFVSFAMSFLEVGKPGLLRWVLQQKQLYSGVLCGLGNDDEETVVYVLSVLRDRILTPESLVPPGLRSVLFGSVTLDQLMNVSGREDQGPAAEIAHNVLLMVCTDPSNGLMSDLNRHPNPLKGNPKRLLGLMKKLKATEIDHHRDLLLAIVKGRLSFCSAYLDEFPFNLEDHTSPTWFNVVSLAADVLSSVCAGPSPSFNSIDMQSIVKCISPRSFTRLVMNKGLLHSDFRMKHGTLLFVLEALRLLDSFLTSLETSTSYDDKILHERAYLRQEVQNQARILLPDPQVLFSLLSPFSSHCRHLSSSLKRPAPSDTIPEHNVNRAKKLRIDDGDEDINILVSGISPSPQRTNLDCCEGFSAANGEDELDYPNTDQMNAITRNLGLQPSSTQGVALENEDTFFYSKLLDTLKIYHHAMPVALEGSFDFFRILPKSILKLPTILQKSLLSMLVEYVVPFYMGDNTSKIQPQMHKYLRVFIDLMMYSPTSGIREQAYILAKAAMLSTGAFDRNKREIDCWFLFIPGCGRGSFFIEEKGFEVFQSLSSAVVCFLCDAVSTTGNNLFKYMELLRHYIYHIKCSEDSYPDFSPLVICVMEKCTRLLTSKSGTFTLADKASISLYVCNTVRHLLQGQVEFGLLSLLINKLLPEQLEDLCIGDYCEWWPLDNLLKFLRSISVKKFCNNSSTVKDRVHSDNSFMDTLDDVRRFINRRLHSELVEVTNAFCCSMLCTTYSDIVQNFPSVAYVSKNLLGVPFSVLVSVLVSQPCLLSDIFKFWPQMFVVGVELALDMGYGEGREDETKTRDISSFEPASIDFAFFLKWVPFHVLFPAVISTASLHMLEVSKLWNLLLAKVNVGTTDQLVSSFRHVLFWIYQLNLLYKIEALIEIEKRLELGFVLIEHIMMVLFAETTYSGNSVHIWALSSQCVEEMGEMLFNHPTVTAFLECPSYDKKELKNVNFDGSLEDFLNGARQGMHKIKLNILNLLKTTSERLLSVCIGQNFSCGFDCVHEKIAESFRKMVGKLLHILKDRFEPCLKTENLIPLIPTVYALHTLICSICPFLLLELANWLFSRVDPVDSIVGTSFKKSVLSVGLHIAGCAFDMVSASFSQLNTEQLPFILFWKMGEKRFDAAIYEMTYFKVFDIVTRLELDVADSCLLKALNVANMRKVTQRQHLPFVMVISRVIADTPMSFISHCIQRISKIRSDILFLITRISPLHLSVFGKLFIEMMNEQLLSEGNLVQEAHNCSVLHGDFVILLPVALSYLTSPPMKHGRSFCPSTRSISSLYWKILIFNFSNSKRYVCDNIFVEEFGEVLPSSLDELLDIASWSLLGKAVIMLQYHINLNENTMKLRKRVKVFHSVCSCFTTHDHLLDFDVGEIELFSVNQSLNFINMTVTKILLCKMLLFPVDHVLPMTKVEKDTEQLKEEEHVGEISSSVESSKLNLSRTHFLDLLVTSWQLIVKKLPIYLQSKEKVEAQNRLLFRHLEIFILRTVLELVEKMHDYLLKLPSMSFIGELVKLSLLHRFEDHLTLKVLRSVLAILSEGKFSCNLVQLLIAHSKFAATMHSVLKLSESSPFGFPFKPISSILRSVVAPYPDRSALNKYYNLQTSDPYLKRLEVVKLLRVLIGIKADQYSSNPEDNTGINTKELLFLLLSSYGATTSEVDLEIYNLMKEIENIDESNSGGIAELDYVWGEAAIKIRKECEQDQHVHSYNRDNLEIVKERRRIQLRENVPVDPKLCATTVLHFPYGRTVSDGTSKKVREEDSKHIFEGCFTDCEKMQTYDPIFLLQFSIHNMSMGYIEPIDFASLGLLAVTFVTISSPDEDTRKLGYEALGKFKSGLEKCQKRKDVIRLRLLLTYLQNGIKEPWQRIPSITAIFLSEASFVLLDPSHDHYSTINNLIMHSPSMNVKEIPMFHDLFWSSSVSFKTDRLWILRLLYAGLNSEDDFQVYIRNSVFEILLSFFSSPLSDDELNKLILQVVKKAVKLNKKVRYLAERCNLIPWLSNLLSFVCVKQSQEQRSLFTTQLMVALEVVHDVILSGDTVEWLQKCALEQLAGLSSHLYGLLVDRVDLIKEKAPLVIYILQILTSTLRISQKRKVYQPHFTLSVEGLFRLFQAIDEPCRGSYNAAAEFGLKTVLMSQPPLMIFDMEQEKFFSFTMWAVSTALQSDKVIHCGKLNLHFTVYSEEVESESCLVSRLLRWLTASAILGILSWKDLSSNFSFENSKHGTLQSLLEQEEGKCLKECAEFGRREALAATILYLQHLLGIHSEVLPSVVSALSLLLFCCPSNQESNFLPGCDIPLASLCTRVRIPVEANPAWRWSFYQPWNDLSYKPTNAEWLDELHACQSLLVLISNSLGKNALYTQFLSYQDVVNTDVHNQERSFVKYE